MENYEKISREELKKLHAEIETRLDDIEEVLTQMDRDEADHEAAEAEADAAKESAKLVGLLRKRYGKAGDWPANISDYWRK